MYIPPTKDFRGLVWEPSSEQDVVILFGQLVERGVFSLWLDYSWTAFPDCVATNSNTGQKINIEFEFRTSGFLEHLDEWNGLKTADPKGQWWLVAWKDDLTEVERKELDRLGLEIVVLRDRMMGKDLEPHRSVVRNWYDGDDDDAEQMFAWRTHGLSEEHCDVIQRLRDFGESTPGFSLTWPKKPDLPWFTVKHQASKTECFKVHANGLISFPFSRWKNIPRERKTAALARLDKALGINWFAGREGKKKGCDLAWLLSGRVDAFVRAWAEILAEK